MARTNAELVKAVLLDDYGPRASGILPSLTPFINAASLIMDRVQTCAINRGRTLSTAELLEIETWTAAYFYTKPDPAYQSKSSGKSSGAFIRDQDCPNPYLSGAMQLDTSGCLTAILKRQRAMVTWGGLPEGDQLSYEERNGTPGG